jgi:hypothetical protein
MKPLTTPGVPINIRIAHLPTTLERYHYTSYFCKINIIFIGTKMQVTNEPNRIRAGSEGCAVSIFRIKV